MFRENFLPRFGLAAALFFGLSAGNCSEGAEIVKEGKIDCFTPGLLNQDKTEFLNCELSAVVVSNVKSVPGKSEYTLVLATDKQMPGFDRSIFFEMSLKEPKFELKFEKYLNPVRRDPAKISLQDQLPNTINEACKIEGLTIIPEHNLVIATTAFNNTLPNKDCFHTVLAWPIGRENEAKVIEPTKIKTINKEFENSIGLRNKFLEALGLDKNNKSFIKIEALAAIPPVAKKNGDPAKEGKLLFGFRQKANTFTEDSGFSIIIVEMPYSYTKGVLTLGDAQKIYEEKPATLFGGFNPSFASRIGLSSLEYDPGKEVFYFLTSYEITTKNNCDDFGGYLWSISLKDLYSKKAPTLVALGNGKPLKFSNKPEGLAILENNHLLIIHDDDRQTALCSLSSPNIRFHRDPHQAAYSIVKLDK